LFINQVRNGKARNLCRYAAIYLQLAELSISNVLSGAEVP
jgi:hypothetical protein